MPKAVWSQVSLIFRRISWPGAGQNQLMLAPRDVLRRHSLVHQTNHKRVIVSCDACRANKTKCSGGTQCSLCARRGINCSFQSGLRRSKRASINDAPTADDTSVGKDDNNHSVESIVPPSSRPERWLAEDSLCTEEEHYLPNRELFLNLTIASPNPAPTSESQSLTPGMEAIYDLLVTEKSSLEGIVQESDEFHEWVARCLEAYLENFHLRWPLLNAPSFDLITAPLYLAASVFVVGTWLRNNAEETERLCALQVHELLLQYLLHDLVSGSL